MPWNAISVPTCGIRRDGIALVMVRVMSAFLASMSSSLPANWTVFGVALITFAWPGITLGALVLLFGAYDLIDGTMAFDRKDYGMNKGIPLIKIANRVEVNVSLKWKRISGPPPVFQQ